MKRQVIWIFLMPSNVEDCEFLTIERKEIGRVKLNEIPPQIFLRIYFFHDVPTVSSMSYLDSTSVVTYQILSSNMAAPIGNGFVDGKEWADKSPTPLQHV